MKVNDKALSTIIQIVDIGNDIGLQMELFPEISVDEGQNFEFFHTSNRVFDNYFFRRCSRSHKIETSETK